MKKPKNSTEKKPKKLVKRITDIYAKFLFTTRRGRRLLKDLLNALLSDGHLPGISLPIGKLKLLDKEPAPMHQGDKLTRMDLLCEADSATLIDAEFQTAIRQTIGDRLFDYIVKIAALRITVGRDYGDTPGVVLIVVTDQKLPKWLVGNDVRLHHIFGLTNLRHAELLLTSKLEIHFLELANCPKIPLKAMTRLEQWAAFLNRQCGDEEFAELNDPIFNLARELENMFINYEDFLRISKEREERDRLTDQHELERQKAQLERQKAQLESQNAQLERQKAHLETQMAQRVANGDRKRQRSVALNMLKEGLGIDLISRCTGLDADSIKNLSLQPS